MATATETPKRKSRTKSKNDAPPVDEMAVAETAGGQDSTDSQTAELSNRLLAYGFTVTGEVISQWGLETRKQVELTLKRWDEEFAASRSGEPLPDEDRTEVSPLLAEREGLAADVGKAASELAVQMWAEGRKSNPYPPRSAIAATWQTAFDAAAAAPAGDSRIDGTAVATSIPAKETPVSAAELAAKREAEFALQQQRAIEDAQGKIELALEQQQIAKSEWNRLKKRPKSVKQDYDDAVEEAQEGYDLLRDARDGNLPAQRQLPFKDERDKPSVPDVNVKATGEVVSAPVVDNGAAIPLDHLVKKEFAEYFDTDNELGISAKQMEEVKKVAGETIGSLENWLNANGSGEWGWKNLADRVEGVGKATIDKLRESYLFARGKYPMPDPTEARETATEQPQSDASLTAEEALARLDELVKNCESLAETCESDDGVEFLTSVGEQASSMRETIEEHENVTADQSRAIVNWEAGVAKWDKGEPIGTTEGTEEVDDLEEDLD